MTSKLLSCPFCGGEADFHEVNAWWVHCNQCHAETEAFMSPEEATEAWNRRATPPPSTHLVAVQALAWRQQGATWIAETPFGGYQIDVAPYVGGPACHLLHGDSFLSPHASVEEAQSAADLDHSDRVMSCLAPPPQSNLQGDGETAIIECLAAGEPFVFDPATNFLHADDGTVEGGIRYAPGRQTADDKNHPIFIAGYTAGLKDGKLECSARQGDIDGLATDRDGSEGRHESARLVRELVGTTDGSDLRSDGLVPGLRSGPISASADTLDASARASESGILTIQSDHVEAPDRLLAQVASIICDETCGLTSQCKSREAAKALLDRGYLKLPPPQTNTRWLPIALADKTITNIEDFSEVCITLRTSDRYWVRDDDGRIYEAAWSEGDRDYWWDFAGESPVDPVEFMPHPLDPRFQETSE